MDGFLNILKPPGMTSADVVFFVRKRLPRGVRVGHGGTLDPDACGVLPVCVGNAVRLFDYIVDKRKVYLGEISLGAQTDTQDASGVIVARSECDGIGAEQLRSVLSEFTGVIRQTPPAYSAVHKNGKRLYELARAGKDAQVESREALIDALAYVGRSAKDRYLLRVTCGKGVYIRTLFHDIGARLGCLAHMSMLIREEAGAFDIRDAVPVDEITADRVEGLLLPLDMPLGRYPAVRVGAEREHFVRNGNVLAAEWLTGAEGLCEGDIVRLYMDDAFAGMGEVREDGSVRFRAMLLGRAGQ